MEKPSNSKCAKFSSSADRISDLPNDVICRILSRLPTRNAAATSILSNKWKSLWTEVPLIDFEEKEKGMNIVHSVNSALSRHRAERLEKFRVKQVPGGDDLNAVFVRGWVRLAIAREVRVLDLQILRDARYLQDLPDTLFMHEPLESLSLSGYFLLKLPTVVRLPKLHVLKLTHVVYHDGDDGIQRLVSGSPVLQYLMIAWNHLDASKDVRIRSSSLKHLEIHFDFHICLDHIEKVGKLEIDAPNLEHLILDDFMCTDVLVSKMTSLISVTLILTGMADWYDDLDGFAHADGRLNSTVKLLQSLNSVKHLKIKEDTMMALSFATIPLSASFERLTELDLGMDCCHWSSLGALLCHAIRLQVLKLTMDECDNYIEKLCWEDPEQVPRCLSSSLVQISIEGLQDLEDQMAMVRYILRHGCKLRSVDLSSPFGLDSETKFRIAQKILMFPRASGAYSIKFE